MNKKEEEQNKKKKKNINKVKRKQVKEETDQKDLKHLNTL